jgi:hypothetical protein
VGQSEPAADQAAIAEQLLDLFRRGIGGDVEVLRVATDQQVADGATYQVGTKAGLAQPIQDAQRVGTDVAARDIVLVARNKPQGERRCNWRFDVGGSQARIRIAGRR